MRIQENQQPHRSKSVVALMAKRAPMALEVQMGPEAVRHLRDTCQFQPALNPESREAQLLEHIHNGEENEALKLLDAGAYCRAEDEAGLSLLHHAAAAGMLQLTDRLFDKGAYADAVSIMDESVLTYVILMNAEGPQYTSARKPERGDGRNNILSVIDRLLKENPNLDEPDGEGNTAAMHAAYIGDAEVMQRLKTAGANLKLRNHAGADITYKSAQAGHFPLIEQYLHWGIDPRPHSDADLSARDAAQALANISQQSAWRYGQCIGLLARGEVIAGAREIAGMPVVGADLTRVIDNVNAFREIHEQALARSDNAMAHVSIAITAEMCGFESIHPDSLEMFMLSKAVHNEQEMLQATLERGADATVTDPFGRNGIMLQSMRGFHAGMVPLHNAGCSVNAQDAMLESPLHAAAMKQNRDGVRILLSLGANPLATNWKGLTPRQQMVLHYETPVSDGFNAAVGDDSLSDVIRSPEDLMKLLNGGEDEKQRPFVAVIASSEHDRPGVDPVILAMLQMAEGRWQQAEANYQAAQHKAKLALN